MKLFVCSIVSLLWGSLLFGQDQAPLVFDTTSNTNQSRNNHYYSKTDFSLVDTLSLWNYKLVAAEDWKNEGIKLLGRILFWRTKPIDDKISKGLYDHFWTPQISFEIYNLFDSAWCYQRSSHTRILSSCVPPDVGGDIIQIDKYILLNRNVCLNCERYDTKVDYCRPVINTIFSALRGRHFETLQDLAAALPIKKGTIPKAK